jgi:hypothetical protein
VDVADTMDEEADPTEVHVTVSSTMGGWVPGARSTGMIGRPKIPIVWADRTATTTHESARDDKRRLRSSSRAATGTGSQLRYVDGAAGISLRLAWSIFKERVSRGDFRRGLVDMIVDMIFFSDYMHGWELSDFLALVRVLMESSDRIMLLVNISR